MDPPPPYFSTKLDEAQDQSHPSNPYFDKAQINPQDANNYRVICIGLSFTDRIELIGFKDKDLIDRVVNGIRIDLGGPIQKVKTKDENIVEIKLSGHPWSPSAHHSVSTTILLNIFRCMARNGWNFIQSGKVKSQWNRETLYFEPASPDPETRVFALSFNLQDWIGLIDCDEMYPTLRDVLTTNWKKGIKEVKSNGGRELKLRTTFYEIDIAGSRVDVKLLLAQVVQAFRLKGYKFMLAADINVGRDCEELSTWIFRKITPFYH